MFNNIANIFKNLIKNITLSNIAKNIYQIYILILFIFSKIGNMIK